jgi:hypothetical protein
MEEVGGKAVDHALSRAGPGQAECDVDCTVEREEHEASHRRDDDEHHRCRVEGKETEKRAQRRRERDVAECVVDQDLERPGLERDQRGDRDREPENDEQSTPLAEWVSEKLSILAHHHSDLLNLGGIAKS